MSERVHIHVAREDGDDQGVFHIEFHTEATSWRVFGSLDELEATVQVALKAVRGQRRWERKMAKEMERAHE